jgi:hypothetical protein
MARKWRAIAAQISAGASPEVTVMKHWFRTNKQNLRQFSKLGPIGRT